MIHLGIWVGLTTGNFLWSFISSDPMGEPLKISFFQGIAIGVVYLMTRRK